MSRQSILKNRAFYALWLVVGLLAIFVTGGVKSPGLDVVVEHLDVIGPRQWLSLLTGSIGASWSRRVIGPVTHAIRIPNARGAKLTPANDNSRADEFARAG